MTENTSTGKWIVKMLLGLAVICVIVGAFALVLRPKYNEIVFAINHPELVREVRKVYEHEHKKADENVLLRQRMELVTEPTATVEPDVKK